MRKIVWAVDPLCDEPSILKSAARALRDLVGKGEGVQIQPVFVWHGSPLDLPFEPNLNFWRDLKNRGEAALDKVFSSVQVPGVLGLQVLHKNFFSDQEAADGLVAYAKSLNAELIVISSHGRKGLKRLVLGSFAETLALRSTLPLFITKPGQKERAQSFKNIVFPTDFSEASKKAFLSMLDFAKAHRSRVLILHQVSLPPYPTFELAYAVYVAYEKLFVRQSRVMEDEGRKWVALAKGRGVQARALVDRNPSASIEDSVNRQAKRLGAMVAVASQSGPMGAFLLGSTARKIVRSAERPVWILHSEAVASERPSKGGLTQPFVRRDLERDLHLRSR